MKKLVAGILAHVDAGKTTLSEAMLYTAGNIKKLGRVDKGDAFLDTFDLEKKRGITIFSKQAVLRWGETELTLLDTPGHVDFSAEMERTLQVLDYAVVVISGTDGVQGHTETLWRLLNRYKIPAFLFINKMDVAKGQERNILADLAARLGDGFVDFGQEGTEAFYENLAVCGETALNQFLKHGAVEKPLICDMILNRQVFPCLFGSALRLEGLKEFMDALADYMIQAGYQGEAFGARVFKITRDQQGNRLTHMKITGGVLKSKALLGEEKVNQIRIYSGEKYEAVGEAGAGCVCAVTGLLHTFPGQGLGREAQLLGPVLEPVITCRVMLPEGTDAAAMLPKLRLLEEEDPALHISWEAEKKELHARIMGEIQIEILKSLILERFGVPVEFGERSIVYKETICNAVEGVGHFEPLRHYAEVHLLLEPAEEGSGLSFDTACSEDILDKNWQRLIISHLEEKVHKGVLTGSAITDMKITLVSGRAHKKHTEGGDFRQAVYRAVRQGLMQADSALLEPFYGFTLEIPERLVGRAMADVERMNGSFTAPEIENGRAFLRGSAPVVCMDGYQREVNAYTGGMGRLTCVLKGYGPCHNEDEVINWFAYDPEADFQNPPSSVFCAHGAGFVVAWDEVKDYMHLESCMAKKRDGRGEPEVTVRERKVEEWIGTEEIDAILNRTFHANKRGSEAVKKGWKRTGTGSKTVSSAPEAVRVFKKEEPKDSYLLVDGYNIIYAWEELRALAEVNIDSARGKLLDILCNYQGMKKCNLIAVFDAYKVPGHKTEFLDYHNIHVVYTKEAETADQYIEKFAHENGRKYNVTVATSDGMEQIIIRSQGCRLLSARDFEEEVRRMGEEAKEIYESKRLSEKGRKNYLLDSISEKVFHQIDGLKDREDKQ